MMLYIYANLNIEGGFFGSVITERIEPEELKENYVQLVVGLDQTSLLRLKECDLYCLGKFDNVSGEIIPEKQFLLHCGEVVSRFIKTDEVKENGTEQA